MSTNSSGTCDNGLRGAFVPVLNVASHAKTIMTETTIPYDIDPGIGKSLLP